MADLKELMQSEEFMNKFMETQSAEEAAQLFVDNGVETTPEELVAALDAAAEQKEGELDANELDNVSGGLITECLVAYGGYQLVKRTGSLKWWADRITGKKKW